MDEITFSYAGEITYDGRDHWTVVECSECGALLRDKGEPTRNHIEFHARVRVVTR